MFSCWFDVNVWFLGMFVLFQSLRQSMGWGGVGWGMGWANNVHVGCRKDVMLRHATSFSVEVTSNGVGWGGVGWANSVHVGCRMDVMLRHATLWRCWSNFRDTLDATLWRCWSNFRDALDATLWRCWSGIELVEPRCWIEFGMVWSLPCQDNSQHVSWQETNWSCNSTNMCGFGSRNTTKLDLAWIYCRNLENSWNRSTRRSDTGSEQTADVKKLRMCFGNMFSESIFFKNRVFTTAKTTRS